MSVANALESAIVVERRGGSAAAIEFDGFIEASDIELIPISIYQFKAARLAWQRFGKGKHPAQLNFGDCFAYALASVMEEPLLFKGFDFARTDITAAVRL